MKSDSNRYSDSFPIGIIRMFTLTHITGTKIRKLHSNENVPKQWVQRVNRKDSWYQHIKALRWPEVSIPLGSPSKLKTFALDISLWRSILSNVNFLSSWVRLAISVLPSVGGPEATDLILNWSYAYISWLTCFIVRKFL